MTGVIIQYLKHDSWYNIHINLEYILKLAWEPSAAKVTKRYSNRAVYPHLNDFTSIQNISYLSRLTQLRILKPSREHSRGSPGSSNQNLRQIGSGVPEL